MADPFLADLQRAAAALQSGRPDVALETARAVARRAPDHPEAAHLEALALGGLSRFDESVSAFERAARIHPNKAAVLANLGNALTAAGRLSEAVSAFERALGFDPRFANGWSGLATALRRKGDAEGAANAAAKAVAIEPENVRLLNNLGVALSAAGRPAEAEGAFSDAIMRQPHHVQSRLNRGKLRRDRGALAEALDDFVAACAAAPGSVDAHHQRANCLRLMGRFRESEEAYLKGAGLDPTSTSLHGDLVNLLWETGATDRHFAALDRAIAKTSDPGLLDLKAGLAIMTGDVAAAEEAADALMERSPTDSRGYARLARVRRVQGDRAAAAELARAAHEKAPGDFEARHEYAECLLAAGRAADAVRLLLDDAPREHLQRHIALKSLAMRASGDPGYRRWYDYDRFVRKMFIEPPPGFDSVDEFNAALLEALLPLHEGQSARPISQTLYGGTQSVGRLWNEPHPVIQALKGALMATARRYVDELPDDPAHPFLAAKSQDLDCAGAWSVILKSGGGHVDHFHPKGWISASYYVRIPTEIMTEKKAGFLRLGGSGVAGLNLPAERWIRPEEGSVIIFPSYMWHGVEPFAAAMPRVTAPFDLAPRIAHS